jgi:hypothetical protein
MTIFYIYKRVLYHLNVCSRGIISFFINNSSTKQFIVKIVRKIIKKLTPYLLKLKDIKRINKKSLK